MSNRKYLAVALQDPSGEITAFVYDFPGLIVQGDSMADVNVKLKKLVDSFQKRITDLKNNLVLEPVTV